MHAFVVDDGYGDGLKYEVRVYPHRRAYLRACHRRRGDEHHRTSQASTFHDHRVWVGSTGRVIRTSPVRGAIYLHCGILDGEIVTHESLHACLNLYRARHRGSGNLGRNQTSADAEREEMFVLATGRMAQQIADELWKRKLWKKGRH
jgi:hypothetical protein